MLRIDAEKIVTFETDGNYTRVVSMNSLKATLGCNQGQAEQALTAQLPVSKDALKKMKELMIMAKI